MDEINSVFSLFLALNFFLQRWAIWLRINFKFDLDIFIFLNININQTSKEQYLN